MSGGSEILVSVDTTKAEAQLANLNTRTAQAFETTLQTAAKTVHVVSAVVQATGDVTARMYAVLAELVIQSIETAVTIAGMETVSLYGAFKVGIDVALILGLAVKLGAIRRHQQETERETDRALMIIRGLRVLR